MTESASPDPRSAALAAGPFAAVDAYLDALFAPSDPGLDAALAAAAEAGLPDHAVSPTQGKLLYLLARLAGARRILEIGALAGYSAIWLARALPEGGRLVTLELDPAHAGVAAANLERAGLGGRSEVRVGPALELLDELIRQDAGSFDLVFIDADKPNYVAYLERALRLARSGALLLADNVVRGGAVLEPDAHDAAARGADAFNRALAAEDRAGRVEAVAVQQIGAKGHDGLALAIVR